MYHLAQFNIAKLLAPLDSPLLSDFVGDLDRINAIAEQSHGFVWRLKDDGSNNALALNPYGDDSLIVNMSVWTDVASLKDFVYKSGHVEVYMKRAKWFEPPTSAHMVLWWVEAGQMPTAQEGRERLAYLREHGSSGWAFSFREVFEAPE